MSAELNAAARQIKTEAAQISQNLDQMVIQWRRLKSIIKESRSYWEGDACREHQNRFSETAENIDAILSDMKRYSSDILRRAGIEEDIENFGRERSRSLPSDLIT